MATCSCGAAVTGPTLRFPSSKIDILKITTLTTKDKSSSSSSSSSRSCDNVAIDSGVVSSGIGTGSSIVKTKDGGKDKNDDVNNNIHDQDDDDSKINNDEDDDDMTNLATLASQAIIEATVMNEFNSIDETYRLQELKGKYDAF
jgi:hypothetical protein